MTIQLWIAAIGLVLAFLSGSVAAATRAIVKAPMEAEKTRLLDQIDRLQHDLDDQKKDLDSAKAKYEQDLRTEHSKYEQAVEDLTHWKTGRGAAVLVKGEIDSELNLAMTHIGATASSVLVPGPRLQPSALVFLSVLGDAAAQLRTMTVPLKSLAGRVFEAGVPFNTNSPYNENEFFAGIDREVESKTENILTIPLRSAGRAVGVAQFLNKANDDRFTDDDLRVVMKHEDVIAERVADFVRDAGNFEILPVRLEAMKREASILFCDLTASHLLFERMDAASAIRLINDYIKGQANIALRSGATIDKYLGDGVMLRYNVPLPIVEGNHVSRALEAAWDMNAEFELLKRGWLDIGLPVGGIHNRIGLAAGEVFTEIMGHPTSQSITVIGKPVNRAAILCEAAVRDRSVILVDELVNEKARDAWKSDRATVEVINRLKNPAKEAFEIMGRKTP